MKTNDKFQMMTTMNVGTLIMKLSVPTIISMLVSSLYNMVDTYFVGKISTEATAAVGVVFSLMSVMQAIGFYFGHGSGTYISRELGKRNFDNVSYMAATGFFSSLFVGIFLAIFGIIFIKPFSVILGATPTILNDVISYMRIILLGAPFIISSFVLNNQLRFQGSAVYAMIGIVTGAVLNIALDPLFMFKLNMGISGAAIATVISQIISFCLLLLGMKKGSSIKLSIKKFRPNLYYEYEIFKGGLPSLLRQGLGSASTMILNNVAGNFGDAAIAAISVVSRVSFFANSALIGFGQGMQPVVGFNFGAKLYGRVKKAFLFCVKSSFGFLVALSIVAAIYSPEIITSFRDDPEVIKIGAFTLRAYCVAFPLNSVIIMCNMLFQSTGQTVSASFVASARQGLFLIPCLFVLCFFFGLKGVEISQCVSDYMSFILCVPLLIKYFKKFSENGRGDKL